MYDRQTDRRELGNNNLSSKVVKVFDCSNTRKNLNRSAFSLAEVLVTLGVVGVVVAMTLPSLIVKYQKQQTVSRLKKMYSSLTQAVKMSELENGSIQTWSYPTISYDGAQSQAFYNTYIFPYADDLSIAQKCSGTNQAECWSPVAIYLDGAGIGLGYDQNFPTWLLNDGSSISFSSVSTIAAQLYVDINGPKLPNVMGRDIFYFTITKGYGLRPYSLPSSRDYLIEDHFGTCNKSSGVGQFKGVGCATLIIKDGWEIKDDYPFN